MNFIERGVWASIPATGAMTLTMLELLNQLPQREQSPLPPATITSDLMPSAGPLQEDLTMVSHYGYGALWGTLYAALAGRSSKRNESYSHIMAKGAGYGILVWGASYLGLLPGLGVRSQAPRMRWRRNLMMVVAHAVWGSGLASAEHRLRKSPGFRSFSGSPGLDL